MQRWQVLLLLGLVGVASLLLVPLERLVPLALPTPVVRLLALVQPAILAIVAVVAGEAVARRVGFGAPLIDAWLGRRDLSDILRRQLPYALMAGAAAAAILVLYARTIGPIVTPSSGPLARLAGFDVPLMAKLLYGGMTEEILTRWGLVSVLAWIGWRLAGQPARLPAPIAAGAVLVAALLFAAGHLPLLFAVRPDASVGIVAAVLAGNGAGGLLFGALYVRRGIEAAMMAHMTAHLLATLALTMLA